jgi:hypothetical protein
MFGPVTKPSTDIEMWSGRAMADSGGVVLQGGGLQYRAPRALQR